MNNIFASIFSPRKASENREVASSPIGPKSALSTKKLRRKSLPEPKIKRSQEIFNEADGPPTPTKSPKTKGPLKKTGSKKSPEAKSPRRSDKIDDGAADEEEYTFNRFVNHRWNGDSIEIEVEWEKGDTTWEEEAQLHQDAPDALLEYWESQGGRPTNPNNPDLFDILAIRKHSKDRKDLLVEWVGYGPKEASWVPRKVVEETAPEAVAQYWKTVKPVKAKGRRRRRV